jgi:hypothetical protein
LVNALLIIFILIVGWLGSIFIKALVTKGLRFVKLDQLSDRIELDKLLEKGGIKYSLSELIGVMCYWLTFLIALMVAVNAIGLTIAAELLNKIVLYIPHIIAAIFILILAMFVSTLLKNIVQTAAKNAGLSQATLLSKIAAGVVIAFAVFVALEQLKIGIRITELTLAIVLGSVGLGLALAFGLGCKDIVAKFVSEFLEKIKK